jgi:hypothetical protein
MSSFMLNFVYSLEDASTLTPRLYCTTLFCDTLILQFVQYGAGLYVSVGSFLRMDRVVPLETKPCQTLFAQFAVSATCCPACDAGTPKQVALFLFHANIRKGPAAPGRI